MKLQPVNNRILVHLLFEEEQEQSLVLPNTIRFQPQSEEHRTRVLVLAVAPGVKSVAPGDFLLLFPEPNMMPVSKEPALAILDASNIISIIKDDGVTIGERDKHIDLYISYNVAPKLSRQEAAVDSTKVSPN